MSAVYPDKLENIVFPKIIAEFDGYIFQQDNCLLVDGSAQEGRFIDLPPPKS
jgi:hypothetical protein